MTKKQIYLFHENKGAYKSNSLRKCISFLKTQNPSYITQFSYSSHDCTFHQSVTVENNILTDNGLENLNQSNNDFLRKLIKRIYPLSRFIHQLNSEEKKIASLCRAIISQSPYLLLESPEENLSLSNLEVLKDALVHEFIKNQKSIFITSLQEEIWEDLFTQKLQQNDSGEFILSENRLYKKRWHEANNTPKSIWQIIDEKKVA